MADGPQTKNLTLPDAGPSVPLRVAESVTEPPKSELETLDVVVMVGGTQVLNEPSAKSLSCAVVDCDERVSARKLEKQGAVPPKTVSRLMPPS